MNSKHAQKNEMRLWSHDQVSLQQPLSTNVSLNLTLKRASNACTFKNGKGIRLRHVEWYVSVQKKDHLVLTTPCGQMALRVCTVKPFLKKSSMPFKFNSNYYG